MGQLTPDQELAYEVSIQVQLPGLRRRRNPIDGDSRAYCLGPQGVSSLTFTEMDAYPWVVVQWEDGRWQTIAVAADGAESRLLLHDIEAQRPSEERMP